MSKALGSTGRRRARLVAQWRVSGETRAAFARRHGVHPRTFWGWCQADDPRTAEPDRRATFLPVRVVDATPTAPAGEIEVVLTSAAGTPAAAAGRDRPRGRRHALRVWPGADADRRGRVRET
jgi:transposase-like protein